MRELVHDEIKSIAGAECTFNGLGQAAVSVGVAGAIGGTIVGNATLPIIGTVPGWVAGGLMGTIGGAAGYGATCWWSDTSTN